MKIFEILADRYFARTRRRKQEALHKRLDALKAEVEFHREAWDELHGLGLYEDTYGLPRARGADVPNSYEEQVRLTAAAIIEAGRKARGG